jgi:hypothetical protein
VLSLLGLGLAALAIEFLMDAVGWGVVGLADRIGDKFRPGLRRSAARIVSYLLLASALFGVVILGFRLIKLAI